MNRVVAPRPVLLSWERALPLMVLLSTCLSGCAPWSVLFSGESQEQEKQSHPARTRDSGVGADSANDTDIHESSPPDDTSETGGDSTESGETSEHSGSDTSDTEHDTASGPCADPGVVAWSASLGSFSKLQAGIDRIIEAGPSERELMICPGIIEESPLIPADATLSLIGSGSDQSFLSGSETHRILSVARGASLEIRDLALVRGFSEEGGSALRLESARVLLRDVLILDQVSSGQGGSILALGQETEPFSLELQGVSISGSQAAKGGGAIATLGSGRLGSVGSSFVGCESLERGGAILASHSGETSLDTTVFSGNVAFSDGGAFALDRPPGPHVLRVVASEFLDNDAQGGVGGAISLLSKQELEATLVSSVFRDNTALAAGAVAGVPLPGTGEGAGLHLWIDTCVFERNAAIGSGGALGMGSPIEDTRGGYGLQIESSRFAWNQAGDAGGALSLPGGQDSEMTLIQGSEFMGNRAGEGGALNHEGQDLEIQTCLFQENESDAAGGALMDRGSGALSILESGFVSNQAQGSGGAIAMDSSGGLSLVGCELRENLAWESGGALSLESWGDNGILLDSCSFFANSAARDGGAIQCEGTHAGPALARDLLLDSNLGERGGAIASTSDLSLERCVFLSNVATLSGGALLGQAREILGWDLLLTGNFSLGQGGAICLGGAFVCQDCALQGNSSLGAGGALHLSGEGSLEPRVELLGGLVRANLGASGGGAELVTGSLRVERADWGVDPDDNQPSDIQVGGQSYSFGEDAGFSCELGGCSTEAGNP